MAIKGPPTEDQLETHIVCDQAEWQILHSHLAAHGVMEPTASSNQDACDRIVARGLNGDDVTWSVTRKREEYGMWLLTVEKDIRVVAQ